MSLQGSYHPQTSLLVVLDFVLCFDFCPSVAQPGSSHVLLPGNRYAKSNKFSVCVLRCPVTGWQPLLHTYLSVGKSCPYQVHSMLTSASAYLSMAKTGIQKAGCF